MGFSEGITKAVIPFELIPTFYKKARCGLTSNYYFHQIHIAKGQRLTAGGVTMTEKTFLQGFNLDGATVEAAGNLTVEVLAFEYKEFKKFNTKDEYEKKLVLGVRLPSGELMDWIPNKQGQKSLRDLFKTSCLDDWVGNKVRLYTEPMMVSGEKRPVICVSEDL
jgi:hypothetical protein